MDQDRTILKLENIVYKNPTGINIFNDLSLTLERGRTVIVVGSTGAGKTTLAELVIGNKNPDLGNIELFGKKANGLGRGKTLRNRRLIGGVGGVFRLIDSRTVYENIILPLIIKGEKPSVQRSKAVKIMNQLGLEGWKNNLAGSLSRGQKNMVMLARAVIADQPLLIIDEPLAGLDKSTSRHVNKTLQSFAIGGHSMLILTSGQTELFIPDAAEYNLGEGVLR